MEACEKNKTKARIMKAAVFGATKSANELYCEIQKKYEIVTFTDNDKNKWGKEINGISIIPPKQIMDIQWDEVIITSMSSAEVIANQLIEGGVPHNLINTSYVELRIRAREAFLKDFAKLVYRFQLQGCVAEAGVFQGEFAKVINRAFPDRKLYLFDTFEGFDERDIQIEEKNNYSDAQKGYLNMTSEKMVLKKMEHPENCVIRKGYFPESAVGIDERFCFVNIDMDLYKPTLEALHFFWERMECNGIIVVHDFYSQGYIGVRAALEGFIKEYKVFPFPIGDSTSIAIQKT